MNERDVVFVARIKGSIKLPFAFRASSVWPRPIH